MNNITAIGRLTSDPTAEVTASGKEYTRFCIAGNRSFGKDENGNPLVDFINCMAWGQTAVFISKYFPKGKMIYIAGELQSKKYKDKDGNNRISWEINVQNVTFCGDKTVQSEPAQTQTAASIQMQEVSNDEDLPF